MEPVSVEALEDCSANRHATCANSNPQGLSRNSCTDKLRMRSGNTNFDENTENWRLENWKKLTPPKDNIHYDSETTATFIESFRLTVFHVLLHGHQRSRVYRSIPQNNFLKEGPSDTLSPFGDSSFIWLFRERKEVRIYALKISVDKSPRHCMSRQKVWLFDWKEWGAS